MTTPPITRFGGLDVLFVMATEQEYGRALRDLFTPLMIGVGPVEAATGTATALASLAATKKRPDLIVSLGSAGSPTLDHAAVYQVTSVAYRDMDASPLGFARGQVPFTDVPAVIPLPHRIPQVPGASLSTGGDIVTGDAYGQIEADMVDMETYAVVRAAAAFAVPVIGLRGISDGKGVLNGLDDWTDYLHVIDERLAGVLKHLAEMTAAGRLALDGGPNG
ncbi:MAG: 5'-methylthioadenosine/S-adenosylhomocysteine nucleosidase [Alphaproteobacteria bacterium]